MGKTFFVPKNAFFILRIALLFCKITLLFSRSALLFPGIVHSFSRSALLFSRNAFLHRKNALLFSRVVHKFPRIAFFLLTVCVFFQECFFPQLIVPSTRPNHGFSERQYLPCSCFVSSWNYLLTN